MTTRLSWGLVLVSACLCLPFSTAAQQEKPDTQALIEQLKTPGKEKPALQVRRDAALALSELGPAAAPAVPALITALDDRDTQVWFHSVTALARIGDAARAAIPALVEDLSAGGRRGANAKWYRSAYALGNMGPGSIPDLTPSLKDNNAAVRAGVALAFGWMKEEAATALPNLLELLQDEEVDVRRHAAESIGKIGPQAIPSLLETLDSSNHLARLAAVHAVKSLENQASSLAEPLIGLTQANESPDLQAAALNALAAIKIDDAQLSEITWKMVEHSDSQVRHEVANVLLDLPPDLTIERLTKRLQFEDLATQLWAADLVGRIGPVATPAVPRLIELVNQAPHAAHRELFSKAIANLGPAAVDALFAHLAKLDQESIGADHWIVKSLGNYGIPGLAKLNRGLSHDNASVRLASIYAVRQLGTDGRSAVTKIERSLHDPDARIRSASLLSLVSISTQPNRYLEDLRQLLGDSEPYARQAAATAVPHLSSVDDSLIAQLGRLLMDPDEGIRLACTEALASLGEKAASQSQQLAALLVESNHTIQYAAVRAIGETGQAPALAVLQIAFLAEHGGDELKLRAIHSLGSLKSSSPQVQRVFRSAISHQLPDIREAAIRSFNQIIQDPTELLEVNVKALDDEVSEVRLAAARNIGALEDDAISATPILMEKLADQEYFRPYLDALRRIPVDFSQFDHYRKGLEHRSSFVKAYAAESVGRLGEKARPAIPILERLAEKDDSGYVRSRAKSALEKITGEDLDD